MFDRARRSLRDGLGLDPGPVLVTAEATMLGIDPNRRDPGTMSVVGRTSELAELDALVADGGGILVRGEPGIGVSSLLSEVALRHRRERTVARTECSRAAAVEASAAGAHRDAAEWFAQAGVVAGALGESGVSERIRCSIGEGDELRLAGDPRQEEVSAEAFEVACASGQDGLVAEAAYAILQLGFTTGAGRSHDLVRVVADRTMGLATGDHRARVMAATSLGYSMTGEVERCRSLWLDAESLARDGAVRRHVLPFADMRPWVRPRTWSDVPQRRSSCSIWVVLPTIRSPASRLVIWRSPSRSSGPTAQPCANTSMPWW